MIAAIPSMLSIIKSVFPARKIQAAITPEVSSVRQNTASVESRRDLLRPLFRDDALVERFVARDDRPVVAAELNKPHAPLAILPAADRDDLAPHIIRRRVDVHDFAFVAEDPLLEAAKLFDRHMLRPLRGLNGKPAGVSEPLQQFRREGPLVRLSLASERFEPCGGHGRGGVEHRGRRLADGLR